MTTAVADLPIAIVILCGVRPRSAKSVVAAIAEHTLPLARPDGRR